MSNPKEWYLIPWSVGFECQEVKPKGHSICVIEKSAADKLAEAVDKHIMFGAEKGSIEMCRLEEALNEYRGEK